MRCDRCRELVDQYELGGATAIVCQACGFVGVPVDHESEPRPDESWQDAFDRFYAQFESEDEAEDVEAERGDETESATDDASDLTVVDGVGSAVAERLRDAGYESVGELASATPDDLEAVEGIGPKLAAKLLAESESIVDE